MPTGGSFYLTATVDGGVNMPSVKSSLSAKLADEPDKIPGDAQTKPVTPQKPPTVSRKVSPVTKFAKGGLRWGFRVIKLYAWADVALRVYILIDGDGRDPGFSPLTDEVIMIHNLYVNN